MQALALVLVFVLGRIALAPESPVQQPRYLILDQHVRNVLAADWDAHAKDTAEVERAYCITFQQDVWITAEWVWRVTEISPATDLEDVTPHSVTFRCPFDQPNVTGLHVHPFASCISDTDCVKGGSLSAQCFPSPTDRQSLVALHKPFIVIQCGRDAWVPVYPGESP